MIALPLSLYHSIACHRTLYHRSIISSPAARLPQP